MVKIAFTGPMRSGKTSGALHLTEGKGRCQILSFADAVKVEAFDVVPSPGWGTPMGVSTPEAKIAYINRNKEFYRPYLQKIGEDRRATNPDYWIDKVHYRKCLAEDQGITTLVVDDLRYENEFDYLKSRGFTVIKLVPDTMDLIEGSQHPSEQQWFDLDADITICKRMKKPISSYLEQLDHSLSHILKTDFA